MNMTRGSCPLPKMAESAFYYQLVSTFQHETLLEVYVKVTASENTNRGTQNSDWDNKSRGEFLQNIVFI